MGGARFIEGVHTLTKQRGTGGLNCGFWAFAQEATRALVNRGLQRQEFQNAQNHKELKDLLH